MLHSARFSPVPLPCAALWSYRACSTGPPPRSPASPAAPRRCRVCSKADASPTREPDGTRRHRLPRMRMAKQQDWPVAPWLARAAGIDGRRRVLALRRSGAIRRRPERRASGRARRRSRRRRTHRRSSRCSTRILPATAFASSRPRPRTGLPVHTRRRGCVTRPPEAALGAPLIPYLAAGPDAARWRRWQNELQMLLFEHAVNRRREASAHVGVDSVWLWGGGTPCAARRRSRRAFLPTADWSAPRPRASVSTAAAAARSIRRPAAAARVRGLARAR